MLLKMRSNTYIFGGPVAPPYLEAVCTVCDILMSDEYKKIIGRLHENLRLLNEGLRELDLVVQGGQTPIVSVLVGDEEDTLNAGNFLFQAAAFTCSRSPSLPCPTTLACCGFRLTPIIDPNRSMNSSLPSLTCVASSSFPPPPRRLRRTGSKKYRVKKVKKSLIQGSGVRKLPLNGVHSLKIGSSPGRTPLCP